MKRFWLLALTAATVATACPMVRAAGAASAASDAGAKAAAKPAAKAPMVPPPYNTLNLTDEQKGKVLEALNTKRAALADWDSKHGKRDDELHAELFAARTAGDRTKIATTSKEIDALRKERLAIDTQHDQTIQELLTPEQREKLGGQMIFNGLMIHYRKITVTEAQKTEIRARAMKGIKEMGGKEPKTHAEVMSSLESSIDEQVLTAEQRDTMRGIKPTVKPVVKEEKKEATTPATPK